MKATVRLIFLLVLVALFISCQPASTAAPTLQLSPTVTPVPTDTPIPPEPTPSVYDGLEIVSVEGLGQIEGMPPGFGGTGKTKDVFVTMRDDLNAAGYSPIVYQDKVSFEHVNGIRLCIMPGPVEVYDPDLPNQTEDLLGVVSGVARYGVSGGNPNSFDDDIRLTDVILAVTITDQSENVTCVMGRANKNNPDGWLPGTLRILLVDTTTNRIVGSTRGAYKPEENVHLKWTDDGPVVMAGDSHIEFATSLPEPTSASVPTATPKPESYGIDFKDLNFIFNKEEYVDPVSWPNQFLYAAWKCPTCDQRDRLIPYLKSTGVIEENVPDEITFCKSDTESIGGAARIIVYGGNCNQVVSVSLSMLEIQFQSGRDPIHWVVATTNIMSETTYPNGNNYITVNLTIDWETFTSDPTTGEWFRNALEEWENGTRVMAPVYDFDTTQTIRYDYVDWVGTVFYYVPNGPGWKDACIEQSSLLERWANDFANPPYELDGAYIPVYLK